MKKIYPADVAPLLGLSAQAVRVQMQRGILDIGICTKHPSGTYSYVILPEKLYRATGIKYPGWEPSLVNEIDYEKLALAIVNVLGERMMGKREQANAE